MIRYNFRWCITRTIYLFVLIRGISLFHRQTLRNLQSADIASEFVEKWALCLINQWLTVPSYDGRNEIEIINNETIKVYSKKQVRIDKRQQESSLPTSMAIIKNSRHLEKLSEKNEPPVIKVVNTSILDVGAPSSGVNPTKNSLESESSNVPTAFSSQQSVFNWSHMPSLLPTKITSETSSDMPSSEPSSQTSFLPSLASSESNGNVSDSPSLSPSRRISSLPSLLSSDKPSASSGNATSTSPSSDPSSLEMRPRVVSTTRVKSDVPSATPSIEPTVFPSVGPTNVPSTLPSVQPSWQPTTECHDSAKYRSPLNNLTCEFHATTDCTQWNHLGLSLDEVEDLVNSCPISCMVPCGALQRINMNVSYRLSKVDNFLAPESVKSLESITIEYLTKYVKQLRPSELAQGKLSLYHAELLSQTIISKEAARRRKLKSEADYTDLAITTAFRGFAIDISLTMIEADFIQGILSNGFTNALRSSGDVAFTTVEVLLPFNSTFDGASEAKPDERKKRSPGIIFASIIGSLAVISLSAGCLIHRARSKNAINVDEKDEHDLRVMNSGSPQPSLRMQGLGVLSFESVMRMVSSPRSEDSSTRNDESSESDHRPIHIPAPQQEPEIQPKSIEPAPTEIVEHPLTGIIPPMIVFDLHDENNSIQGGSVLSGTSKIAEVVPTIHVKASPTFLESLCTDKNVILDESTYEGLFPTEQEFIVEPYMCTTSSDMSDIEQSHTNVSAVPKESEQTSGLAISVSDSFVDNAATQARYKRYRSMPLRRKRSWIDNDDPITKRNHFEEPIKNETPKDIESGFPDVRVTRSRSRDRSTDGGSRFMQSLIGFSARHLRKPSIDQDTAKSDTDRTQTMKKAISSPDFQPVAEKLPSADGKLLIFWAPLKGKLGLLIQSIEDIGPVVTQVKDYSPLLGSVHAGDRIIEIDGVSTVGMPISYVLFTISDKQASRRSTMLRLVVWRATGNFVKDNDSENDDDNDVSDPLLSHHDNNNNNNIRSNDFIDSTDRGINNTDRGINNCIHKSSSSTGSHDRTNDHTQLDHRPSDDDDHSEEFYRFF